MPLDAVGFACGMMMKNKRIFSIIEGKGLANEVLIIEKIRIRRSVESEA